MKFLSDKVTNNIIFFVCGTFILGGAVNTGFSDFLGAVPFFITYVYRLINFEHPHKVLLIVVLLIICSPVFIKESQSTFFYPCIGTTVELKSGWGYMVFKGDDEKYLASPEEILGNIKNPSSHIIQSIKVFSSKKELKIIEVTSILSQSVMLSDELGMLYSISPSELLKEVNSGNIKSKLLEGAESLESTPVRMLGYLMLWPIAPMILIQGGATIIGGIIYE